MSYNLNSLKVGYIRDYIGTTIGGIKGDSIRLSVAHMRALKTRTGF